jgi:hypothetical protein
MGRTNEPESTFKNLQGVNMSLHLDFEPHSWYMNFAINHECKDGEHKDDWRAYTDNGNTYRVDELYAFTLKELRQKIRTYHLEHHNGYGERIAKRRLEQLRKSVINENISYAEIHELQSLADYIDPRDLDLLEAAAVPEDEIGIRDRSEAKQW